MNIKRSVIISSLSLILLISVVYLLFFKEEKLEDISIQVKSVREMKDYDIPSLGQSVEDKIYDKYDTVKFGRYYQDKAGTIKTPIDWIVLEKQENNVLLISKYLLDCRPIKTYTEEELKNSSEIYTWKSSTLRKWLNNEFYNIVFNIKEKKKVKEVELENENEESNTKDKVFLLSEKEFRKYFENNMYYERLKDPNYGIRENYKREYDYNLDVEMQEYINAMTVGTDYAFSKGLVDLRNGLYDEEDDFYVEPEMVQPYWLRTPTNIGSSCCCRIATTPYFFGIDKTTPAYYPWYGIRPAIWVSLEE